MRASTPPRGYDDSERVRFDVTAGDTIVFDRGRENNHADVDYLIRRVDEVLAAIDALKVVETRGSGRADVHASSGR